MVRPDAPYVLLTAATEDAAMADATANFLPIYQPQQKLHREDLKPGEILCSYCTAKCCRYFALPIDIPETWSEFEYIRWYLLHDRATVFVEDESWYLLVHTKCKHLGDDHRCGIYETRPKICRDYTTKNCEYEDDWVYDHYWETPEQVEEYAEAVLGPRKGGDFRSPKPK
jgi:Fe-S-cluster containining protein